MSETYVYAVDMGSCSIKLAIARKDAHRLEIIYRDEIISQGIKKGTIINTEACVDALKSLFYKAEQVTGLVIDRVRVSYSNESIESINSHGVAAIGLRGIRQTVTELDKQQVIAAAQAVVIPEDRILAHIIPLRYIVDNQDFVKDPINMIGVRLEAEAHIISAPSNLLDNISFAIERTGKKVSQMVYSPLATAEAVLNKEEKERGVILLDIGASTTKMSFYFHGKPYYNATLPIGSFSMTHDLVYMLDISEELAEQTKCIYGCVYRPLMDQEEYAYLPGTSERSAQTVSLYYLCDILSARLSDIYHVAFHQLKEKEWFSHAHSIVIAGGGATLPGSAELATKISDLPARLGYSMGLTGLSEQDRHAKWSTVVGLLKYEQDLGENWQKSSVGHIHSSAISTEKKRNFMSWLRDFF
jgi:cell division protein FtsA